MKVFYATCLVIIINMTFMPVQLSGTCQAEELGRLFTTAEERAVLDKMRHQVPDNLSVRPLEGSADAESVNNNVAVRGYVYRKKGKSTVWTTSSITGAHDTDRQLEKAGVDALFDFQQDMAASEEHSLITSGSYLKE